MKTLNINDVEYEIMENEQNCLDKDELCSKMTDYFEPYDYVFGDYAYDKLRLKGFYDSKNKNAKKINDIKFLSEYKKDYCSFGAKTFLIKKVK